MNTVLSTTNISLYTLPVAWINCIGPHIHALNLYSHYTGTSFKDSAHSISSRPSYSKDEEDYRFDRTQPRTFTSLISQNPHPALTRAVKARLHRLEAASTNGYENLGLFCASVVAANLGLLAMKSTRAGDVSKYVWWINVNSVGYVVCRIVYEKVYDRGVSGRARGGWFYAAVGCCFSMIIRAANVMRKLWGWDGYVG